MASLDSKLCSICADDYDNTNHKSVTLSCSHEFCLLCLVRMKALQSTDCPQCRQSFADFELPISPRMIDEISPEVSSEDTMGQKGQNLCSIKKKSFIGCQVHEKPFVYWYNDKKEFYCIKCVVSLNVMASSLELIDDSVPLIQADIKSCALAAEEGITNDWEKHKAVREEATQHLDKMKNIREAMQQLEEEFRQFIQDIDCHNANRREQSDMAKKIREAIPEIKSDRDIESMIKYKKSLHELQTSTQMPCKTLPVTLLSKIAWNYAEADRQEDFIKKFSLIENKSLVRAQNQVLKKVIVEEQQKSSEQNTKEKCMERYSAEKSAWDATMLHVVQRQQSTGMTFQTFRHQLFPTNHNNRPAMKYGPEVQYYDSPYYTRKREA